MDPRGLNGDFRDPDVLPDRQRRLHRAIQRAAQADRAQNLPKPKSDDARRWPGLVKPNQRRTRKEPRQP